MFTWQRLAIALLAALLAWGIWLVMLPFLPAIGWAGILALVTWGLYERLRAALGKQDRWAALAMTALVALVVILPIAVLGAALVQQAVSAYQNLQGNGGIDYEALGLIYRNLSLQAGKLPLVGSQLASWLKDLDLPQVQEWLRDSTRQILSFSAGVGRTVSESVVVLALTIFTLFFVYASGDRIAAQVERGLARLGGEGLTSLLAPAVATIRAVVLGLFLTAFAQGVLAGLGFWVAQIDLALVLGMLTTVIAILQVPTPLIWLPCVVFLALKGQTLAAIGLFAWGTLVVSTIDNFIRPIFISQGTGLPFLLVFFGVLGGLLAFGTLGIVLGPVLLTLGWTLWRQWVAPTDGPETPPLV